MRAPCQDRALPLLLVLMPLIHAHEPALRAADVVKHALDHMGLETRAAIPDAAVRLRSCVRQGWNLSPRITCILASIRPFTCKSQRRAWARCREHKVFTLTALHKPRRRCITQGIKQPNGFRVQVERMRLAILARSLAMTHSPRVQIQLAPLHSRHFFAASGPSAAAP